MTNSIGSEILRAIGYIFISAVVYFTWRLGNGIDKGSKNGNNKLFELTNKECLIRLAKGILIILAISYVASFVLLGNSTDCSDETDPIRGSCTTTVDFQPTAKQKNANFAYYITLLGLPYLAGGINKLSKIKNGEVEKEYQKHMKESAKQAKENEKAVKIMMAEINSNTAKVTKKEKNHNKKA